MRSMPAHATRTRSKTSLGPPQWNSKFVLIYKVINVYTIFRFPSGEAFDIRQREDDDDDVAIQAKEINLEELSKVTAAAGEDLDTRLPSEGTIIEKRHWELEQPKKVILCYHNENFINSVNHQRG